jgi:hypothetical protein
VAAGGGLGLVGLRFQLRRGPIAQAAAIRPDPGGLEAEADRTADHAVAWSQPGSQLGSKPGSEPGAGAADARSLCSYFSSRLGQDLAGVRIHAEGPTSRALDALGANAAAQAEDIYFGTGRYRPETPEGAHLLAHELTHVVQQRRGGAPAVLFDIPHTELAAELGTFVIQMLAREDRGHLEGTIRFIPDLGGPRSQRIGLIQIVRQIDRRPDSPQAGQPVDIVQVLRAPAEARALETTGLDPGWSVDLWATTPPRGTSIGPTYQELAPGHRETYFGWLEDWGYQEASLYDRPGAPFDSDFAFETMAYGLDNGVTYGVLEWGFSVRETQAYRTWRLQPGSDIAPTPHPRWEYLGQYRHVISSTRFNEPLTRFSHYYNVPYPMLLP